VKLISKKCSSPEFHSFWCFFVIVIFVSIISVSVIFVSVIFVSVIFVSVIFVSVIFVSVIFVSVILWVSFCFMSQGLITMPRNTSFAVQIMMAWYTYLSRWFWDRNRKCVIKKHWQSSHLSRIIRVDYYLKSMVKKCEKAIEHFKTFLNFQTTF